MTDKYTLNAQNKLPISFNQPFDEPSTLKSQSSFNFSQKNPFSHLEGLRQDRLCPFATVKFLANPNTDEVCAKIGSVPLPNTDLDLAHDRGL
ncbi:hypothetical protein OIU77_027929 [Salix suchowensis]|uniref:Uncharacterized protein n=1 Tax=Salix suchowensis TaxID=1278906 RepID=A0ABQ9BU69_9ROSI|nr:hypothetical protein OIU77_027929 [Salix suchowensis]